MSGKRLILSDEDYQTQGYREMIRNPEAQHLSYMIKYVAVLEQTSEASRQERRRLLERIEHLERENERLGREVWEQSQYIAFLEDEVQNLDELVDAIAES